MTDSKQVLGGRLWLCIVPKTLSASSAANDSMVLWIIEFFI